MIAVLRKGITTQQKQHLIDLIKQMNLDVHVSEGVGATVLSLIGDTSRMDMDFLQNHGAWPLPDKYPVHW